MYGGKKNTSTSKKGNVPMDSVMKTHKVPDKKKTPQKGSKGQGKRVK